MRIDVITIFPDYLAPLDLSLIGKARRDGRIDLRVHDLRDFTHDRHRTVDDTPYGGGAGMVMKPAPWGEALAQVAGEADARPVLIIPGPGGDRFDQSIARDLAERDHLVFACGRYEGIDERVYQRAAADFDVRVLSLGDYVLNGGEVATLAMTEAIARLIPGVIGNAQSLVEESHEDGLLEYPVYTKPVHWQDLSVPEVLLSGDHGKIASWRHEQRLQRTAARRPDLLPTAAAASAADLQITVATPADAGELLTLTHACWLREGIVNQSLNIPAQHETLESLTRSLRAWTTYVARVDGRMVASVRGRIDTAGGQGETGWDIGRLMVAPDLRGRGFGRVLLDFIQQAAPDGVTSYSLTTGEGSADNQRMYRKAGFRIVARGNPEGTVTLAKRRRPTD
ncbi:MAG TPA: tRNA (guanosine(37)-N1)-methyltransferase TrmD [Flexivirga sp.]|uniref:tRNA (guanosine(37)-N1)-methyltransferase TrmD n=1 Tax=Flexivirga sp. TaxID=1962927 RepID=UPI002CAC0C7E|nr:tRNA (guanosine(37)-N1)-methyltransferase TrmD [Flexivirga sp.]HWC22631.1 tRNA (guanosine(37)-N1)-methyltransferase TrmD [Flexivirga sp.]